MTRRAPRTLTFAESVAAMSARELRNERDSLAHRCDCLAAHPLTVSRLANRRDIEARLKVVQAEIERRGWL